MCSSPKTQAPPPPPPPPEAAPVQFGEQANTNVTPQAVKKTGTRKLQIPLTPAGGTTGLGIPSP